MDSGRRCGVLASQAGRRYECCGLVSYFGGGSVVGGEAGVGDGFLLPILGMDSGGVLSQADVRAWGCCPFYLFVIFLCLLVFFSGIRAPVHNGS